MSRQEVIGFVLIFVILMVWLNYNTSQQATPPKAKIGRDSVVVDTFTVRTPPPPIEHSQTPVGRFGKHFASRANGTQKQLLIETDRFLVQLSSKGGMIRKWELKNYKAWDGIPVQLVDYDKGGDFSLYFITSDGKVVNTKDLYFDNPEENWKHIKLTGKQTFELRFVLPAAQGGKIVKIYKFNNQKDGFDFDVQCIGMGDVISNFKYFVIWENGLRFVERNSVDECTFASAYAYSGKELINVDAAKVEEQPSHTLTGVVDWVAITTKYFGLAIIPQKGFSSGASMTGSREHFKDGGAKERYSVEIEVPYTGKQSETASFKIFLGPLVFSELKSYDVNLEQIMSLGWQWVIRPIAEYIMIPLFLLLHMGIPNWGIVIIVFSIIIKIALHPLTRSQMKSMKKMQQLQPLIEEIKEKHKEDAQKMNMAVMQLYKEYGVNPVGGCLPLLLQMPILFALYNVFRGAIELRQASFVGWITDLSVPDPLFTLPFHIPFFGFNEVSGLALIMGISMFIQQKMTVSDPRQKAMVWMMPILMTLLFNSLPSGLNLYYLVFNFLSIGQQFYVNRKHDNEPLRKVEQKKRLKGGLFSHLPSTTDLRRLTEKKKK
jgi:YidC/Oxa1 family membrane protein insertase